MYEVKDGKSKVLRFEGDLIASSSSERPGSNRWVEFQLYRTVGGSYVLARAGISVLYHRAECPVVRRNKISSGEVREECQPCPECNPDEDAPVAYVEQPRYWAQVSESPDAVFEALYKYDDAGARYLTSVAARLIEQACEADKTFSAAYQVEYVY